MLFLVDGYNVTRQDPVTAAASLIDQREALFVRLRVRGRDLLGRGRVVIVFDGEGGPALSTGGEVPVEIVYAHKRSADDEIVRIASAARDKVVVVTSDRRLLERLRERVGVRLETRPASSCFEGSGKGADRKGGQSRGSVARDGGLPRGASAITRELKDLWLTDED